MTLDEATLSQNRAADPDMATWLSANAGSGKTRVLTDRVARLLLNKVPPQNILCLTYTKAAASEMQNRLFKRLGDWALKPDGALAQELHRMGATDVTSPDRLAEARRLFARAIETPGGLRIQTIHSFCASLLRRFPLEAGVSPSFVEMDDRSAQRLRQDVVEAMATGPQVDAVDAVAALYTGEDLDGLTQDIVGRQESFARPLDRAALMRLFDCPANLTPEGLLDDVFDGNEADLMTSVIQSLRESSKKTDQGDALKLAALNWNMPNMALLEACFDRFLYGEKTKNPFAAKTDRFPTKDCKAAMGSLADDLDALMERVQDARPLFVALQAVERADALHRFAAAFLPAYEARKLAHGWLDFDDLILKTRHLLSDPAVADWVLYRLDGGLDHILVDEAQDTSPVQWQVIEKLAQEFTSGKGARDEKLRTIFVVGDKKQSIYSFQGADPEEFDRMRDHFRERLEGVGHPLQRRELEFSFRSSAAILRLVDTLFTEVPGALMEMDARHRAFHADLPGRVDLWPAVPVAEAAEPVHWYDPVDVLAENHHDVVLAHAIARNIRETIASETIPAPNGTRRRVKAGDFLILVRRRSTLFTELIRACKAEGLPVAGADRLKLGGELAVKDLAAVLSFLATPEDDLSLAAALRSPLFGWSEDALFRLAAGRGRAYLWNALRDRAAEYPETMTVLDDLRGQTDFLRPYDLIERILARHDGRRKLLARLGSEAEDGIDSLLNQALAYERMEVPSLTGFLTWLETDDVEVKRQMDNAGDQIRVMTVHGSKGLEAPIVILPDTNKRRSPMLDELVTLEGGETVWKTPSGMQPEVMKDALDDKKAAQAAEALRLLYVAITRAETWLIVAAAGDTGEPDDCWHGMIEQAVEKMGPVPIDTPVGEGLRATHGNWDAGALVDTLPDTRETPALPAWIDRHLPQTEAVRTLSPSDLGGAKVVGAEPDEGDLDTALRRGRMAHLLLEHLPLVPEADRARIGRQLLEQGTDLPAPGEVEMIVGDVGRILQDRSLGFLFAPEVLSEVDLSATLAELGEARIHGTVDKLLVTDDTVLAVDFKTNRIVPDSAEHVPLGVLRQMAAYDLALRQIYPQHRVETAILWTTVPALMRLPHDIVRASLQNWPTS